MAIKRNKPKLAEQIKSKHRKKKDKIDESDILWLHTGSVILNIKCSGGNWEGGHKEGKIASIIGDSDAGKSILVMTGLAHAANNPKFDNYRFIIDDAEEADSFDHSNLFGEDFAKRLERPAVDNTGRPTNSATVEEFSDNVHRACDIAENDGKPFIYVLDSLDSIDSDKEIQLELDNRSARENENLSKVKDSYGGSKQKYMSKFFRQIKKRLRETRSFLIIVCQTRDELKVMSFATQRVAGGRARKFYSSIEAWLANISTHTKTVAGKKYPIGVESRIKISKNKYIGKKGELDISIYPSYGVDDITSCVNYLILSGHWKKPKGSTKIKAPDFDIDATLPKIVDFIEKKKLETKLFKLCSKVYKDIESQLDLTDIRKKKFR